MKNLILPPHYRKRKGNAIAVRYQTFLCDADGRIEKPLQSGSNMITDWGMDNLPATSLMTLIDYLHLGDTTQTMKRLVSAVAGTLSFNDGDPNSIAVSSDVNFFEAGDVNRTLKCDGIPEMLVTAFTDAQNVTCKARGGVWHPSYTPTGAIVTGAAGIHYTNTSSLATEFTRFNAKDTGSANNNTEIADSVNSRFLEKKIWLSAVVAGSAWTINQLGWGTNTVNCFGKANLGSPDVVAVGKRYRVDLTVFFGFTPINLSAVTVDWGATVGSYTCDIRQERIGFPDSTGVSNSGASARFNFLRPTTSNNVKNGYFTSAFSLDSVQWDGDAGFTNLNGRTAVNVGTSSCFDSSYVAGNFNLTRTARWDEAVTITGATGLFVCLDFLGTGATHLPALTIRPTSGTIGKANGYRIDIIFPIYWQRQLVN